MNASIAWMRRQILPFLFFVFFIGGWECLIWALAVESFLVPSPSAVMRALFRGVFAGNFMSHAWVTAIQALGGFLLGSAMGIAIAVLVVTFPVMERIIYPYIVALQTVPKVAIAPVIVVWFGFGMESKIIIVALVSLFPVLVNVMAGLKAVDQDRLDLLVSLSATRWQILRYLRFPNALPFLFAGLNTAIVFAIIGAIVGEFVGSNRGIGFLILQANFSLDIAGAFALFVVLSIMGVSFHAALQAVQRRVLFWNRTIEAGGNRPGQ